MPAATRAAPAAPPGIPSDLAAWLEALIEHATDRLGDRIVAAIEAERHRLPVELRLWTAEQLGQEWSVSPDWWTRRAQERLGPVTKPGAGNRFRWSAEDVAEYIRQGRIGPRGKQLFRAV
ncbi:hypothetical protein [Embleya sp. NPDC005971]|uniref:hypothetical protein n=1 Tax=Embleya sp. NPDC005971 TaxID=3156724 RepID=UPI0033E63F16